MFKTYPEHHVDVLPVFGSSTASHWRLVELRSCRMLFVVRFSTRDAHGDAGPQRSILLSDAAALEEIVGAGLIDPAAAIIFALDLRSGDVRCERVLELLAGEEPNGQGVAHALRLASGQTWTLSRLGTLLGQLLHARSVFCADTEKSAFESPQ